MKFVPAYRNTFSSACRAPQGARGLKSERFRFVLQSVPVAPRKGRVG